MPTRLKVTHFQTKRPTPSLKVKHQKYRKQEGGSVEGNHQLTDRCMGYILNKFEQIQRFPCW